MISSSLYIPGNAKITDLSCEILEDNDQIVRGVKYQVSNGIESIVDNISGKPIFILTDNPNVTRLEGRDIGLCFRLKFETPGNEMSTVYRINTENSQVFKISHLFFTYFFPEYLEREPRSKYILGASPESYENILRYLRDIDKKVTENLIVKMKDTWVPFSEIEITEYIVNHIKHSKE